MVKKADSGEVPEKGGKCPNCHADGLVDIGHGQLLCRSCDSKFGEKTKK